MSELRKPLILLVLVTAAVGTGLLAVEMLDRGASDGRRDREAGLDAPAPERIKVDTPPPERKPAGRDVWEVSGLVLDRAERPIPGAVVRATLHGERRTVEGVTDGNGRYWVKLAGPACFFDVAATGYLPVIGTVNGASNGREDFVCEGDGPWSRDFMLTTAASLGGRVMADGRGVPGATVYVIDPEHQLLDQVHAGNVTRTDTGGLYRFAGLAPGTYDVGVVTGMFLPAMQQDVEVPERGEVSRDFELKRGRAVELTVRNATDRSTVLAADARLRGKLLPPGGVEVLALALVGREFIDLPVATARVVEGRAVVRALAAGPVDVEARDPERITEPGLSSVLATLEPRLELTLVPARRAPLVVLDAATRAPLDPAVRRETVGAEENLPVEWSAGTGVAVLPFDDRRHTLRFELDGYQATELALPPATVAWPERFEVLMSPAADAETGMFYVVFEPELVGRVALVGRDADGRQQWVRHLEKADEQSRWAVTKVPLGEYSVSVLASKKVPVVLENVVVSPGIATTHRVRLSEGGGLSFKVVGRDGKLLEKVWLMLRDEYDRQIDIHILTHVSEGRAFLSVNFVPSAATAKADSGLAPGAYFLRAVAEGFHQSEEQFVIRGTETAEVTVTLDEK